MYCDKCQQGMETKLVKFCETDAVIQSKCLSCANRVIVGRIEHFFNDDES